ncbi:MAG: outer membrane beta-barrel protein [Bacteroidales bacterium]|nr:outer membrane beta-barrel protein [Bacteroidales bacterium]
MKKLLLTIMLCVFAFAGYAQKGEMTASAQFMLGAGQGITNAGLGAKFSYSITDPWRVAASFDYGFRNKSVATWDINVDAHYQFFFGKGFRAYPLAGFTVLGYQSLGNTTCVGMNLGGGAQYDINDSWAIYSEVKGQLVHNHGSRFGWSIGGSYKF